MFKNLVMFWKYQVRKGLKREQVFAYVLGEVLVKRFRENLGENADEAIMQYVKLHVVASEHELVERMAEKQPNQIKVMIGNMAMEDDDPKSFEVYMELYLEAQRSKKANADHDRLT